MKKQSMPKVNLEQLQATLTDEEMAIVSRFIKKDGTIRASRPSLPEQDTVKDDTCVTGIHHVYKNEDDRNQGRAAYTWRHVVFYVSTRQQHRCMPSLDFCYLDARVGDELREEEKRLQDIASKVVDCVPVEQWHGVRRWGQAFGMIGSPKVCEDGAIIYR